MKLKTRKAVVKRIRITGTGKVRIRCGGQDHFNARESGKVTINKRKDKKISCSVLHHIKKSVPYL